MSRFRRVSAALVLACLALAGGCGGTSTDAPKAVVERALATSGPAKCDLYTDAFFAQTTGGSPAAARQFCRTNAATLPTAKPKIVHAVLRGQTAFITATAGPNTVTYRLVNQRGQWLIDGFSQSPDG